MALYIGIAGTLLGIVVGGWLTGRNAHRIANATFEHQRKLAAEQFARERRERQASALLAGANKRRGLYQNVTAADDPADIDQAMRAVQSNMYYHDLSYTGIADPDVEAAIDEFSKADEDCRGLFVRMHRAGVFGPHFTNSVQPVVDVASALAPVQRAIAKLNLATNKYIASSE